jgi:molecular chaperone DnaJ
MPSMAQKRDYYEVLGVERTATVEVIKRSYKKLAGKYHPDRNPGDAEAVEKFKECAEAFDVLSNPEKRERYDRFGHAGVNGPAGGGFRDVNDIFDAFGDLFGDFGLFGNARRAGGRGRAARRGANLRTAITIELAEAAEGTSRTIELDRRELCDLCDGSGAKPGTSPETCQYCGGAGQVVQTQGFFRLQTTCPACSGAGQVTREKCPKCSGSGRQAKRVKLEVRVPAGVDSGMQLCLRGEGEPGPGGGPRGDLYVDLRVNPHPLFDREGRNLICQVPVTYTQLCLGAEVEIPLLRGRHVLTIPPGTQPDEAFRLDDKGLPDPHGGPRGDLFVHLHLEVPRKLGDRQEELLRELAEEEKAHVSAHRKSFFEKLKEYFAPEDEPAKG